MLATEFQPVTPDPKKNYRTALILLLVMIIGGIVILKAYEKRTKEGESDGRPSFVTQISEQKDLVCMQQDGELLELKELKGKVILVQVTPNADPDPVTTGVMQRFSEKYAEEEDFALLTLMLDPGDAEGLKAQLEEFSKELGAELPQWVVASNERETLHKFVKNEFKANQLPHEAEGKWVYDKSLVLIDRNRHVRRAVVPQITGKSYVVPFDFDQAGEWDNEGVKTGTDLSNVEQMEVLLANTIDLLLAEGVSKEEASGNPVIVAVGVGVGFLILLILIRIRSKSSKAQK
ncbi:MAG: hypothetical protein ABJQ29_15850 [Luteolibacter sp.]